MVCIAFGAEWLDLPVLFCCDCTFFSLVFISLHFVIAVTYFRQNGKLFVKTRKWNIFRVHKASGTERLGINFNVMCKLSFKYRAPISNLSLVVFVVAVYFSHSFRFNLFFFSARDFKQKPTYNQKDRCCFVLHTRVCVSKEGSVETNINARTWMGTQARKKTKNKLNIRIIDISFFRHFSSVVILSFSRLVCAHSALLVPFFALPLPLRSHSALR